MFDLVTIRIDAKWKNGSIVSRYLYNKEWHTEAFDFKNKKSSKVVHQDYYLSVENALSKLEEREVYKAQPKINNFSKMFGD